MDAASRPKANPQVYVGRDQRLGVDLDLMRAATGVMTVWSWRR